MPEEDDDDITEEELERIAEFPEALIWCGRGDSCPKAECEARRPSA
jgi:hypothetical protein